MDTVVQSAICKAAREAAEGRLTLAELAGNLGSIGVERFHVDLVRRETTYYHGDYTAVLPAYAPSKRPDHQFSAARIELALSGAEIGAYTYPAYCGLALSAGCVGFIVSIVGHRALYYGAGGEVLTQAGPAGSASTNTPRRLIIPSVIGGLSRVRG